MEKLALHNWNDKKANEVKMKADSFVRDVESAVTSFSSTVEKVKNDNAIQINHSFDPDQFKV